MTMEMNYTTEDSGDAIVAISGEITLRSHRQLSELIEEIAESDPPPPRVILDLRRVDFVDSVGLGSFIKMFTSLKRSGSVLVLRNLNRNVRESLELTRLDKLLSIE